MSHGPIRAAGVVSLVVACAGVPPVAAYAQASPAIPTPPPITTVPPTAQDPPPGVQLAPPAVDTTTTTTAPPRGRVAVGSGQDDDPGFFDVGGRVQKAINDWFRDLVASALTPALDLLGRTVLATPDVTGPGRVRDLWAVAAGLANAIFVLFALAGGVIVMGHETVQTRYSAKEIAPRLVLGMVAANASLTVAGAAIGVANALSAALLGQGVDPANATATMRQLALAPLDAGGIFLVLVGLVAAVMAVVLLGVYVIRVALVVLVVAAAPLALACHALPQTEGLAQLWWRGFTALLAIQVGQSLVLIAALRIFFASDGRAVLGLSTGGHLVDLLVVACLLWVLLRIPTWAARAVFGARRGSSTLRMVKHYVIYKGVKAATAALT